MPWSHSRLRRWPKAGHPLLHRIHPRGTIHRLEAASTATVPSPPTLASFHSRPFFCIGLDKSLRNYIREKWQLGVDLIHLCEEKWKYFGWTGKGVPSVCFCELIVNNRWNIQQSLLCKTLSFLQQEIEDFDNHLKDWRGNKRNSRVLFRRIFVIPIFGKVFVKHGSNSQGYGFCLAV